jgi:hypothetical protein
MLVKVHIVNRKAIFFKLLIIFLPILGLLLLSYLVIKSRELSLVFLALLATPFFLMPSLFKKNTRQATMDLSNDHFIVDANGNNVYFNLRDLSFYKIKFPNRRFASIVLGLRSGKTIEYSFFRDKRTGDDIDTDTLLDSFHKMMVNYNSNIGQENKVLLRPSLYASPIGLYIISCMVLLLAVAVSLHIIHNQKAAPAMLILGFSAIIQLIAKRQSDLALFKKLSGN